MTANTDGQLEGTKKRASLAPAAKKAKARASKNAGKARGVAAAKAAAVSNEPEIAADATEKEKSQAGTPERMEENPQEVAASGTETTSEDEVIEKAHGTGDESPNKNNGAKNPAAGGDSVKPLTEAGKKRLVDKLLGLAETQATQGGFKITPADLIRLMQLHKEMTPQRDRKVTVQWIEDKPE
jgi:hypothetical protein